MNFTLAPHTRKTYQNHILGKRSVGFGRCRWTFELSLTVTVIWHLFSNTKTKISMFKKSVSLKISQMRNTDPCIWKSKCMLVCAYVWQNLEVNWMLKLLSEGDKKRYGLKQVLPLKAMSMQSALENVSILWNGHKYYALLPLYLIPESNHNWVYTIIYFSRMLPSQFWPGLHFSDSVASPKK